MAKLFAMEEVDASSTKLLIDKVLEKSEQPKSPLSLTSDLLQQRKDLQEEITKELGNPDEEKPQESNDSNDDQQNNKQEQEKEEDKEPTSDNQSDEQETSDNDSTDEKDDGEDPVEKDDIKSLVGSGLKGEEPKEKKESPKEDKKEEPATESMVIKSHKTTPRLNNLFSPVSDYYSRYKHSLEAFNLSGNAIALEAQPIVYVKDSIIESLNNLVQLSNTYATSNEKFIETMGKSAASLNERITVFKGFVEREKYQFTQTLVKDPAILGNISVTGKSDIRDTVKILLNYLSNSDKATGLQLKNGFDTLSDSFNNSEYAVEAEDFVYKEMLPGFNLIRMHLDQYKNYLTTNIQNYQYYKLHVLKTEDLYSLNAISVTEDKELHYILDALDKLLVQLTMTVDNLTLVGKRYTAFIDEVKVLIYDIQNDKYKDLSSVGIDQKVKEFIQLKLAIESYYINSHMVIDYMTGVMSTLSQVVELTNS